MNHENSDIAYGGYCAFAVSSGKMHVKGGKYTAKINGIIYNFSNPIAQILFRLLPNRIEKANKHWQERNEN